MSHFEALTQDHRMGAAFNVEELSSADIDPVSAAILLRVRIKAGFRAAWLRKLWAEEGASGSSRFVTHEEADAILEERDSVKAEALWIQQNPDFTSRHEVLMQLEDVIYGEHSRFAMLCRIFSIGQDEADLLQVCYALHLDPGLSRLYAYLQDNPVRNYACIELVRRLFSCPPHGLLHPESPLQIWQLVHEHSVASNEPQLLALDPMICEWLQGRNTLDRQLVEKSELCEVHPPLDKWPLEKAVEVIQRHLNDEMQGCVRVIISGPEGCGRSSFAAALAVRYGMNLLAIHVDSIHSAEWHTTYRHAQRQAFLDRTALCWKGDTLQECAWPGQIIPFPLQFVVLSPDQSLAPQTGVVDHRIELPALSHIERQSLWRHYLPESAAWPQQDFAQLVNQHQITVGEIAAVAAKRVSSLAEVQECLKDQSHHRLGDLAQYVECPFSWDDLILPAYVNDMLQDMLFEATERNVFWENGKARRMFPQGRGLMGMFCGPPGTGKTMSAQVLAAELGVDLFRIDLASVVSKYVGETSKNLAKVLSRAQHMDVVLLFDEADALLGKRTEIKDAHDRFANTDTNYLLQALEDYRGIAILSTNKKSNIDEAFLRRIRYVVDFPQPDQQQRFVLWQRLLTEIAGDRILDGIKKDIHRVANQIEMTGAQIKFSILGALFSARRHQQPVTMEHLLRGINRELMKEDRVLSEHDKQRLHGS